MTVISPDVAAADAWATAICNRITVDDTSVLDDLEGGTSIRGGVLAVIGDAVIRWGGTSRRSCGQGWTNG
ncbi:hypothetical protein [Methanoculleus chikugoensis]|uniref:hypothetical protein n=1 Tax=Methanoculleus chikugoensis TaxID=118126 RepID=UPI000A4B2595|nr:hypothetical protein [Methanoculleus chikugoensis]